MRMRNDDEIQLKHLTEVVWRCPYCHKETIRYDRVRELFVCWECCKTIPANEGHNKLDGFAVGSQYFGYGDGRE